MRLVTSSNEVQADLTGTNMDDLFRLTVIDRADADGDRIVGNQLMLAELETALMSCVDSAPGPDGLPYSFLKITWNTIGLVLLVAWNFSFLPVSHRTSFLRLIPKAGKDLTKIGNWRPITLSNTDHKLITKAYSNRLSKVASPLVGPEQTAFISGRLINDNIMSIISTVNLANLDDQVDSLKVSLDARKAFDSVSHSFIKNCLERFGLSSFIPIFEILYKDLSSDIIVNGKVVKGYKIEKGVNQGDALSCILL